ncbi:MAG: multifunctional oxoglutarate decarboxylase/oxoglutarate dehydrogenase thiamine pyrophosphate-binding subunit/dihydrolipoyllysine-residue succinyltransferase subunit, partial [Nocardioidaceae bacterium]|nr:multifunctional oxoglutarate decarboxylase/oxoglutarate dehydrogenase thiamine pyrophosphate-binding subunit/dihydrolipoyllysine-residue succinyltransferase subunit [Nocardioidaceae bacterium]
MSHSPKDKVTSAFGPNEWLVDEMYEHYLEDPTSVDEAWQELFQDGSPTNNGDSTTDEPAPEPEPESARTSPPPPATQRPSPKPPTVDPGPAPEPTASSPDTNPASTTGSAAASSAAPTRDRSKTQAAPAADKASAPVPKEQGKKEQGKNEQAEVSQQPQQVVLRGAAARTVSNMDTSLSVPTATS